MLVRVPNLYFGSTVGEQYRSTVGEPDYIHAYMQCDDDDEKHGQAT